MGLLDDIGDALSNASNSMTPEMRTGLLSGGLAILGTPGSFAQQISRGGLAGMQAYQGAQDRASLLKARDLQMQGQQLQLDQMRRQDARQKQIEALPAQFYRSPAQQALSAGGGPTVANAQAMQGLQPQFDMAGFGTALFPLDPQAALAWQAATKKQQPQLKEVQTVTGPDGKSIQLGIFMDGSTRPLGYAPKPDLREVGTGDRKRLIDFNTGQQVSAWQMGVSPDAALSAGVTTRGQDITAETARRGQDFENDRSEREMVYKTDPVTGGLVAVPNLSPRGGAPVAPVLVSGQSGSKDARDALALAQDAKGLLERGKATSSSIGSAVDGGLALFGQSTEGARDAAKLKVISGQLVSKMPKMSGPQSDKDVMLYKEMAGRVGDESLPLQTRLSALEQVTEIQQRYAQPTTSAARTNATQWTGLAGSAAKAQSIKNAQNSILRGANKADIIARLEQAGIYDHGLAP